MTIQIKRSIKPVKYHKAIDFLEHRVNKIIEKKGRELIWILEHEDTYTAGLSHKKNEILDNKIKIIKTNRGGKITYHGPGQLICYFVINLNNRKRDIRNFIKIIEKTIIKSLKEYGIESYSDRKNIGIWVNHNKKTKKIAAIGLRIKKWIAYHGFAINIDVDLKKYNKIIPCGIKNRKVFSLKKVSNKNYKNLYKIIIKNFIKNLES